MQAELLAAYSIESNGIRDLAGKDHIPFFRSLGMDEEMMRLGHWFGSVF